MTTIPQDPYAADMNAPAHHSPTDVPRRSARGYLAAALVFLGGYLVISSLVGSLVMTLWGFGAGSPAFVVLLLAQFAFAVLVLVSGLLVSPGTGAAKTSAVTLVVVGIIGALIVIGARTSGALRFGPEVGAVLANPYLLTALIGGIAWLIVRRARLGWLSLLAVVILAPVPYLLALSGFEGALTPLVMFTLTAVVGAGIVAAGKPWRD